MRERMLTQRIIFMMRIIDYDALTKFFSEDGRTVSRFLRTAIREELNSYGVESEINQILALGYNNNNCKKQVNFLVSDNDFYALKELFKNADITTSIFFRYIMKKELHRLDIEKEKNQTWDIE